MAPFQGKVMPTMSFNIVQFMQTAPILLYLGVAATGAWAKEVRFERSGKANIKCECVLATSGCESKIFAALAGNQLHSWHYEISVKKDMRLNLNKVCYRKRDVEEQGAGLCCTSRDETKTIELLFR